MNGTDDSVPNQRWPGYPTTNDLPEDLDVGEGPWVGIRNELSPKSYTGSVMHVGGVLHQVPADTTNYRIEFETYSETDNIERLTTTVRVEGSDPDWVRQTAQEMALFLQERQDSPNHG